MDTVAAHNDTILVAAGAYSIPDGGLTVPAKNLTLQAAGEVLYTCSGFGPGIRINTTVRLSGFAINNCTAGSGDSGGIYIYRTSGVVIESVIVEKCHGAAFVFQAAPRLYFTMSPCGTTVLQVQVVSLSRVTIQRLRSLNPRLLAT